MLKMRASDVYAATPFKHLLKLNNQTTPSAICSISCLASTSRCACTSMPSRTTPRYTAAPHRAW
jgi:hypothetical protein